MSDEHLIIQTQEARETADSVGMGIAVRLAPMLLKLHPDALAMLGMSIAAAFGGDLFAAVYRGATGENVEVGAVEGLRLEAVELLRAIVMRATAIEGHLTGANYTREHIALTVNQTVPPKIVAAMKKEFEEARALRDAKKN